jgi:hypothetical protein
VATIFPPKGSPLRVPPEPGPTVPDASPVLIPRIGPSGTPRTHGEDVRTALPNAGTSPRGTRLPQPADPTQNRREQLTGHRHLRQLEHNVLRATRLHRVESVTSVAQDACVGLPATLCHAVNHIVGMTKQNFQKHVDSTDPDATMPRSGVSPQCH